MKPEICFMSRSTELSLPVLRSVVMARVAMLRFTSEMRLSRSRLHAVTAAGCFMATWEEGTREESTVTTLGLRQNCYHLADDIFKRVFLNENIWIAIKISLKFVPKGAFDNMPALVQTMAWRRQATSHYLKQLWLSLPTHICITGLNELMSKIEDIKFLAKSKLGYLHYLCVHDVITYHKTPTGNLTEIKRLTLLSVLTAANLSVGFGELQNSCRTATAGCSSLAVVCFMLTMAWAAS